MEFAIFCYYLPPTLNHRNSIYYSMDEVVVEVVTAANAPYLPINNFSIIVDMCTPLPKPQVNPSFSCQKSSNNMPSYMETHHRFVKSLETKGI